MSNSVTNQIDVMLISDSPYMVKLLSDLISVPGKINVSIKARNSADGLRKLVVKRPNVILIDLEILNMGGTTFIEKVICDYMIPVIVVSNYSQSGAKLILDSLDFGIVDYVSVPLNDPDLLRDLKSTLISKIEEAIDTNPMLLAPKAISKLKPTFSNRSDLRAVSSNVIIIGASVDASHLVSYILSQLPSNLAAGVLVVQHMAKDFTTSFAQRLDLESSLTVREAKDGETIQDGVVLVAPGGYHMFVGPDKKIRLNQSEKKFGVRPSANVTVVSASKAFGANVIGIFLSAIGQDDIHGMKMIKKRGSRVLSQEKSPPVIFGMAQSVHALGTIEKLVPADKLISEIIQELRKMSENSKYRDMFVQEALENIDNLNRFLLKLEQEPHVKEYVDVLFRSAHTMKGMAATMRYEQIREICKVIEEVFDKFRKDEELMTLEIGNVLFEGIDLLRQMVEDEDKKIDLDEYLNHLKNPNNFKKNITKANTSARMKSPTIRVRMEDLDSLVDIVGEMMICKMRLEQTLNIEVSDGSRDILMNLGRLIADLQHQTMKIRMVPINQIFSRFSRMVRDVSTDLGKDIKLDLMDTGLELDRTVLDAITDPLLHMLLNSVDHGIETPEQRKLEGKPSVGTIRLSATSIGDMVEIIVDDDGKGFDILAIKSKAVEKKIITEEESYGMTDDDVIALIGTPGLSSAKIVTDVSGRGVGMDVVMTQVENVGGQVKIKTEKGKGTRIILTIPQSLAIVGGLLVTISNQKYVFPLSSISSTMTITKNEIQNVYGKEMIHLKETVVPLIRVASVLGGNPSEYIHNDKITVVIINKVGKFYGLVVDSIDNEQEIVLKRLDSMWNGSPKFSDATILPDGKVALILEPALLVQEK